MGRPGFPRLSGASAYQTVLGANLCALWHCGSGISLSSGLVTQWTDMIHGIPLTPPLTANRPTYAADGSYFRGLPVVQCAKANYGGLQIVAGNGYGNSTDNGELIVVGRNRVDYTDATAYDHIVEVMNYATGDFNGRFLFSPQTSPNHGMQYWVPSGGGASQGGTPYDQGLVPHLLEGALIGLVSGTSLEMKTWVDGVQVTDFSNTTTRTAMPGTFDTVRIGVYAPLPRGCEFSFALVAYCSNPITTVQRALLHALVSSDFGTP
jgi:hypothetical protein